MGLREDIQTVLNSYNQEVASGTPDFILAGFLLDSLAAFDKATRERDRWWGFEPLIAGSVPAVGDTTA